MYMYVSNFTMADYNLRFLRSKKHGSNQLWDVPHKPSRAAAMRFDCCWQKTCKLSNLIHQSSSFHRIYEEAIGSGNADPSVTVHPELQRDLHVYC